MVKNLDRPGFYSGRSHAHMSPFISGVDCVAFIDRFDYLSPIVLGFPSFFSKSSMLHRGEVQVGMELPDRNVFLPGIPEPRVGCSASSTLYVHKRVARMSLLPGV